MLPRLLAQLLTRIIAQHAREAKNMPQRRPQVMRHRVGESLEFAIGCLQKFGPALQVLVESADFFIGASALRVLPLQFLIRGRELRYPLRYSLLQIQGQDHDFLVGGGQLGLQQADQYLRILRVWARAGSWAHDVALRHFTVTTVASSCSFAKTLRSWPATACAGACSRPGKSLHCHWARKPSLCSTSVQFGCQRCCRTCT